MSDSQADPPVEEIAERLAARGHDALVDRLRIAFADAARAHADIVVMDEERIEALVQKSAETADGLQWRRALANVACEELGINLTEALHHPAVARAQQLVGAPSYEESLAELTRRPVAPAEPAPPPEAEDRDDEGRDQDEDRDEGDADAGRAPAVYSPAPLPTAGPGPEPELGDAGPETATAEPEALPYDARYDAEYAPGYGERDAQYDEDGLRVSAIHLGGVANLPISTDSVDLRLSEEGLDIMQGDDEIIGRLGWPEIDRLEVPEPRGRRRRRGARARLVVRTAGGDASFEVPAFSTEELRERVDPLVARFARD